MFNYNLALIVLKISILFNKKITKSAYNLVLKICPDFLKNLKMPKKIIGIVGTEGKTTTKKLLNDSLEKLGKTTIYNKNDGYLGIIESLISSDNDTDFGIFEIDEKQSIDIFKIIKPDYIICTNIFRDSCLEQENADFTYEILNAVIPKKSHLVLNANDPISFDLAKNNKRTYFSIDKQDETEKQIKNIVNDMKICPKCGSKLKYRYIKYNTIGNFYCEKCLFEMPDSDISIQNIDYKNMHFFINDEEFNIVSPEIYNIYNELSVITLLLLLKFDVKKIQKIMSQIKIDSDIEERANVDGTNINFYSLKCENPVAVSNVFEFIKNTRNEKEIILLLDGKDDDNISWIYDTDFEFLNDKNISKIIIGGISSQDIYIRLLMAGVDRKIIDYDYDKNIFKYLQIDKNIDIYFLYNRKNPKEKVSFLKDIRRNNGKN